MKTATMRYRGKEWPHNPQSLKITSQKAVEERRLGSAGALVRELGKHARIVTGTGVIMGADCVERYISLCELKNLPGSAVLTLPGIPPFYAFFKSLELICVDSPDTVKYSFEFVEDLGVQAPAIKKEYYTVAEGESLWDISHRFSVPIETLLRINPWVKRPDELEEGREARLC